MVRISEQTGFGYLRLSKGELENEKDLLASLEGSRQEGFPLDVLSEKSNLLVNEKRLLASLEGGRQEGFPENCCLSLQQFECLE